MFGDVFFSDARCTLLTPSHYDVIYAKAQGGNTGTFSMLFRMVLRSSPPIFSFVLIFSELDQKMSQQYWTFSSNAFFLLMPNTNRRRHSTVELSCVDKKVWTHPSTVVTQFIISCAVKLLRLVTSDYIMM